MNFVKKIVTKISFHTRMLNLENSVISEDEKESLRWINRSNGEAGDDYAMIKICLIQIFRF